MNQQSGRQVWAKLLNVHPPDNTPLLFGRLAKVYQLPLQITEQVEKHLDNPDLYLRWRPKVEQMLSRSIDQGWGDVIKIIDEATLLSLEYCDHSLSQYSIEGSTDGQQLQKIADMVVELMEQVKKEVKGDGIDPDLATFILDRLKEIKEALDEFSLTGPAGLRRALETNLGSLVTQVNIFVPMVGEKNKSYLKKFLQTLYALATVINITLGALQLPAAIQTLALVETSQAEQTEQVNQETTDNVIDAQVVSPTEPNLSSTASDD